MKTLLALILLPLAPAAHAGGLTGWAGQTFHCQGPGVNLHLTLTRLTQGERFDHVAYLGELTGTLGAQTTTVVAMPISTRVVAGVSFHSSLPNYQLHLEKISYSAMPGEFPVGFRGTLTDTSYTRNAGKEVKLGCSR